nr:hypothetical protein [Gemella sanguinis]
MSINISESKLIIEDNGIGIYEEDLPRIFEQSFTGLMEDMRKSQVV